MAQLRRPEKPGEAGIDRSGKKIAEIVKVAVKDERIGGGKRSHVSDLGKRSLFTESLHYRPAVERAEKVVILFPVHSGRKCGAVRE